MLYPIEAQLLGGIGGIALATCLAIAGRRCGRELAEWVPSVLGRERSDRGPRVRRLGGYALEEKIGEGAMGEVYRARHAALERPCAIKLLSGDAPEREHRRFAQEARLTAQLHHPNAVSVSDYGRARDGTSYYVMELLEGVTLQQLVEHHGPLPAGRVIQILLQLCAALREAHAAGLVHRDVKPDNVFLCGQGGTVDLVKLLDFGLVKRIDGSSESDEGANMVLGTPLYISPEAIAAPATVGPRSDLYGLGALAYFLLTGSTVFEGNNVVELCSHHLHSRPERPSRVAGRPISEDLERVVLDCLAKDPAARPASASDLARRLERCADAGTWSDQHAQAWWADPTSAGWQRYSDTIACGLHTLHSALQQRRACA